MTRSVSIAGVLLVFCYLIVPSVGRDAVRRHDRDRASRSGGRWGPSCRRSASSCRCCSTCRPGATIVCTFGLVLILMAIVRVLIPRRGATAVWACEKSLVASVLGGSGRRCIASAEGVSHRYSQRRARRAYNSSNAVSELRNRNRRQGDRLLPVRGGHDRSGAEARASPVRPAGAGRSSLAVILPLVLALTVAAPAPESIRLPGGDGPRPPPSWPAVGVVLLIARLAAAALRYTSSHARGPPGSHRRARPARRPDRRRRRSRSAAARPTICAWPAARCRAITPKSSTTDGGFVVRDRSSRYGTYVNDEQVTERALVHGDRIRLGRSGGAEMVFLVADSGAALERSPRRPPSATSARSPRSSKACARSAPGACWTTCCRWCWTRRSTSAAPSAAFIMLASPTGELEFKIARGRGRATLPGSTLRDEPQDSRGSVPHRRAAARRRPARRRAGQRPHGHRRARHPQRPVRAAAARAVRRQGGSGRRGAADRRPVSRQPREGVAAVELDRAALETLATEAAVAIENARLYRETMEKARMEQEMRIAAEIQQALLPKMARAGSFFRAAAASLPCRSIGGDFYDYVDLPTGRWASRSATWRARDRRRRC